MSVEEKGSMQTGAVITAGEGEHANRSSDHSRGRGLEQVEGRGLEQVEGRGLEQVEGRGLEQVEEREKKFLREGSSRLRDESVCGPAQRYLLLTASKYLIISLQGGGTRDDGRTNGT